MAQSFVLNWKSTIAGIATVVLGGVHALNGQGDGVALITAGLGLLFAKDGA